MIRLEKERQSQAEVMRLREEKKSQEEGQKLALEWAMRGLGEWREENKQWTKSGLVMKSLSWWAGIVDFGESKNGKQMELEAMAKVDGVQQIRWVEGVQKVYELVFKEEQKLEAVARGGLACSAVTYPVYRCLRKDSRLVMMVVDGYSVDEEEEMDEKLAEAWSRWGEMKECRKRMWRGCEVWNGQVEYIVELHGEVGMDKNWG